MRKFTMMLQSNAWSCLPTAAAMCMYSEPREITDAIGHDGSEIWFPDQPEPANRRGFHVQEIIDVLVANFEVPVFIEAVPYILDKDVPVHPERMEAYLHDFPGILLGQHADTKTGHAVAWDTHICWDPRGQKYSVQDFGIMGFIALM